MDKIGYQNKVIYEQYNTAASSLSPIPNEALLAGSVSAVPFSLCLRDSTGSSVFTTLTVGTVFGNLSGNASTVTNGLYTTGVGTIINTNLANSSITINGSPVSLGGSVTITGGTTAALTIGSGLGGGSFNGTSAVTITNLGVLSANTVTGDIELRGGQGIKYISPHDPLEFTLDYLYGDDPISLLKEIDKNDYFVVQRNQLATVWGDYPMLKTKVINLSYLLSGTIVTTLPTSGYYLPLKNSFNAVDVTVDDYHISTADFITHITEQPITFTEGITIEKYLDVLGTLTVGEGLGVIGDITADSNLSIGITGTATLPYIETVLLNGVSVGRGPAGLENTVLGANAGLGLITGSRENTLVGSLAGDALTTGDRNCAFGRGSLGVATTTNDATAIGHNALAFNTANGTVGVGVNAGDAITTGTNNVCIGMDCLSTANTGSNCTALGANALKLSTTPSDNTALGYNAMQAKTSSGGQCVAVGSASMLSATSAAGCVSLGFQSMYYNQTGSNCTAVGLNAMQAQTIGSNVCIGANSRLAVTNGTGSLAVGTDAARYQGASGTTAHTLSGDYNIYIGTQSRASAASITKELVIGSFDAVGLGSNTTVIGTATTLGNRIFGVASTGQVAPTIASAATIAPTTSIVFISGVTAINTITAPSCIATTGGQVTLIPTGIFTTTVAGNIALASTGVISKALIMTYDAGTAKWYPSY